MDYACWEKLPTIPELCLEVYRDYFDELMVNPDAAERKWKISNADAIGRKKREQREQAKDAKEKAMKKAIAVRKMPPK